MIMYLNIFFHHRLKGLTPKKKYKFRVLAENLAGPGKPSLETDPILVKDPIGMCTVMLTQWNVIPFNVLC